MDIEFLKNIYSRRKVLITGHTGFKGSWLCLLLNSLGAEVYGYSLPPPTNPSLFKEAKISDVMTSIIGDIRSYPFFLETIKKIQPELIIHLAAQPLVIESYLNPRETYEINVMGTVNLLEASRQVGSIKAILNVTTDKCYENKEWYWGYRETEPMGGYDPYSNSKGCSELVTSSFRSSFFNPKNYSKHGVAVATARAGNVIGGGDWANNRLIPDFMRSVSKGEMIKIRSPLSIRPWQHIMEPLSGYLMLCEKLINTGASFSQAWNFGPNDNDARSVEWITQTICEMWGEGAQFEIDSNPQHHEANHLKLDCSKAKKELGWSPKWDIETTLKSIVEWNKSYLNGSNVRTITENQISDYFK